MKKFILKQIHFEYFPYWLVQVFLVLPTCHTLRSFFEKMFKRYTYVFRPLVVMNIVEDTVCPDDIRKDFVGGRDTRNGSFVPDKQRPLQQQLLLCRRSSGSGAAFRLTRPQALATRVPVLGTG